VRCVYRNLEQIEVKLLDQLWPWIDIAFRVQKCNKTRQKVSQPLKWISRSGFIRTLCPRGLKRRFAVASLLRLWVRIPPGAWMSVFCKCCVLSGRGLFVGLITRSEESYRL
jgi:hypothetical protein